MDTQTRRHFADIVNLAQATFERVTFTIDATPERAILRIQAIYQEYHIRITELLSDAHRKYRYYVLRGDWIEAGFDNSPDPRALRLKYGKIGKTHAGEYLPHLHRKDKAELILTDDITFVDFIDWLKCNTEWNR